MTKLFIWRKQQGLTQLRAAEELDLPLSVYRMLEKSRLRPSAHELERLHAHFGEDAAQILEAA